MNKENVDFLKERLFFLGFGDKLHAELEKKIVEQTEKFTLSMQAEFAKGNQKNIVDYSLDFTKSKKQDKYFVNNYTATLKNDDPQKERSHKFHLNNGSGITAKGAYNMLEGRAALNNYLVNKNDEKYKAWQQIDFSKTDENGNHKLHYYHEAWHYDLTKNLNKHPIKELANATQKEQLIKSLEKGNIPQVTFIDLTDGKEEKMFLEANPKDRNLIVYDENMVKQNQGVRQHKPQVNEGQTGQNTPDLVHAQTQGQPKELGGRGATSTESSESNSQPTASGDMRTEAKEVNSINADAKDKTHPIESVGANQTSESNKKKVEDKQDIKQPGKVEKRGRELAPPVRSRQKRRGLSA